ncbi:MAG: DnaJ domain-containing protein [Syntrophales bacterium LBB04]|nr:DnaJ domain-containing protein [Syntrophales bacterium LBB04]
MAIRISAVSDLKVLENYRLMSSLRTDIGSKARVQKDAPTIPDTVTFSPEALDKSRLLAEEEKEARIHQEQLRQKQDEELRRSLDILELGTNASEDEIKRAYHHLISNYHPDKYSSLPPEFRELAEARTKQIIDAYRNLAK